MDLNKFIESRPYLYHLTNENNLQSIVENEVIYSTSTIVNRSEVDKKEDFLRSRREDHTILTIGQTEYHIRDQRPIFPNALKKCVKGGWNSGDFIKHLNSRVFFWPTLNRLGRHFNRYEDEKPIIFQINTNLLFNANPNNPPLFCRLNSGATRPHPYYGGEAPPRGPDTFLKAANYERKIASVAEVTFENECKLPSQFKTSRDPEGPWNTVNLES